MTVKTIRKHRRRRILALFVLVAAVCFLVYPSFADSLSDYRQTIIIGGYAGSFQNLSEEEIFTMKQAAENYNELIRKDQQYKPFRYEDESYDDPLYDSVLRVSPFTSVMAYVKIPFTDDF